MKINRLAFLIIALLSTISQAAVANIEFDITGIDGALKKNVKAYLDGISSNEKVVNFRLESRVNDEAKKALQALGYFHPTINFSVEKETIEKKPLIELDINPGPPILISKVDIKLEGEASTDPAFAKLLKKAPKIGDVLNQGKYDDLKSAIQNMAISRGYFKGKYSLAKLEISPSLNQAFFILHFKSGERYHFGDITYKNSQIEISRLKSMMNFQEGDPYLVTDLSEYNQELSNTDWFSSVLVEAELDKLHQDKVPISVLLDPSDRNRFEIGIGYSTDIGPRFKMGWEIPWFNRKGHSINTNLNLSKETQKLETSYKIPQQDILRDYYQIILGVANVNNNDTKSTELTTSISRYWKFDNDWQRTIYLSWLYSNFTQGEISDISNLILPGINFSRVRNRGGSILTWGDKQSLSFEAANPIWGSDIDLYRIVGESAWLRSLNDSNRFIFKLSSGGIFTKEFDRVPPSLRFFVGGDGSVRGYGYDSISPRDSQGALEGGRYMATASLEYNYKVVNNWWGALFVDGGDAWNRFKPNWKTSVGVGVRWISPIGPVRFDVAHGFENENEKVMFLINLGPEL